MGRPAEPDSWVLGPLGVNPTLFGAGQDILAPSGKTGIAVDQAVIGRPPPVEEQGTAAEEMSARENRISSVINALVISVSYPCSKTRPRDWLKKMGLDSDGETIVLNPLITTSAPANTQDVAAATPARTTAVPDTQASTASKAVTTANPSYVLDLGLNLVVLQFHDERGDITQSIPSERQLRAYRDGGSASVDSTTKS